MSKLNLEVELIGQDGNIFNLMGLVARAMRKNGYGNLVNEFINEVTSSNSYDEALQVIMKWVDVI